MAKVLSIIFLILSILLPISLLLFILLVKKNKKLKNKGKVVFICFLLFIINFAIYKFIEFKFLNQKGEEPNINNKIEEDSFILESSESIILEESLIESVEEVKEETTTQVESTKEKENTKQKNVSTKKETASKKEESPAAKSTQKTEENNGITYVSGYMIVNKTYSLPSSYVPSNTHKTVDSSTTICTECINEEAYQAFTKMKTDAKSEGLSLWIQSGYRSYSYQEGLYNSYVKREGQTEADTYSARPGHSEHQTGLAFDLNSVSDAFASTKEGIWVNDNCYKYGFILRYPKGKDAETGYKYESWHLRYVGTDLSSKLYNNGDWITMESYFGLTSTYSN